MRKSGEKYWGRIKARNDNWVFMDKSKDLYLWKLQWTAIKRHILVKGKASPDNPELREYWQKRQASKPKYFFKTRQILWRRQEGKCPVCLDSKIMVKMCKSIIKDLQGVVALTILTICAYCIQTVIGKYIASEVN